MSGKDEVKSDDVDGTEIQSGSECLYTGFLMCCSQELNQSVASKMLQILRS